MTGDDWHNYFNETYGADNVIWESASIQDIVDMPSKITDFSPKQISDLARKNGWTVEPLGKGSLAGIPYEQGGGVKYSCTKWKFCIYSISACVAADIAKSRGGVTLETLIENNGISMPQWDFNNPITIKAWNCVPEAYAEQAAGEIHAILGSELREGNIWENIELPRLMENPSVTKITAIDPKTLAETMIFER